MFLKSLTCKGFKSFADRSVLSLEPGITAIIGPNGSGKSNVLDAVLWVLGERSARNLRGQAMEDVIFAGSSTRKQVGMAEVVLVLDNTDGTLPVDYAEVSITRRIYRSGENEYLINGSPCRRMDVLDILHDTGLGTGTHSIISQGHLDNVLQSRPEDRRALIEEAAGVLKHKQRKARSERKLERMDQHLLRIRDVNAEVERQLKPLERKAKRAMTYRTLASELAEVALDLAVDDLRTLQARWDATCADEEALSAEVARASEAASQADARVQELQAAMQRQAEDAGIAADALRRVSKASEQLDSTVMLLREKKRSQMRVREEKRLQLQADEVRLESARQAHAAAAESLAAVSAQAKAAKEQLDEVAGQRDAVSREFQDLRRRIGADEHRESQLTRDADRLRAAKAKAEDALSSSLADGKLLAAQREDAARRLQEAEEKLQRLGQEFAEAEQVLQGAVAADDACRRQTGEAFAAVDAQRSKVEAARVAQSRLAAQVAGLEEGERTARKANKALAWAVDAQSAQGTARMLADGMGIPADLTFIVEVLLADAAEAIALADGHAAGDAAAAVASADVEGAVTMVALDAPAASLQVAGPGKVPGTLLVDLLDCRDDYRGALGRLLGDVILCDTIQQARECAAAMAGKPGAWRVASKDGYLADARGVHRFVRPARGTVGSLERHRALEEARRERDASTGEMHAQEEALHGMEERLRTLQKEGMEKASARAQAQGKRDSLADQVDQATADVTRLQRESSELERRQERNDELLERMRPDSERIEGELQAALSELAVVRERLSELRDDLQPLRRRNAQLNDRHTEARLEAGKLAEREAYARRMEEGHRGDIARLEQALVRMRREAEAGLAPHAVDEIVEALSLVRGTVTPRIAAIERQADEYRSGQAAIHAETDGRRREAQELRAQADAAAARLSDARVEKGRLEVQVEAAIATIRDECATPIEQAVARPPLEDRAACEERAASLRRRIANLGSINPDAARDYEELKARYDYLQGQVGDIMDARKSLSKIVKAIDARMKDDFVDTFHAVDANFQRIFAQLFPGGSASLSLVDPEDPENSGVEVTAQPRGKRITKMSLMSGGEKSLTALALLFAVYATRPTPFYILDEVEAALDDTNLRRLCAYLDDMRMRTQLLMITHQRRTMEMADVLYGVSMQSDGVTRVISQKLDRTGTVQEG